MKHTPGPWKISETDPCSIWGKEEGTDYTFTLAQTFGYMGKREENAILIAAAPDLLAALEWALDQIHVDKRHTDSKKAKNLDMARAAIAKAKGQS